MPIRPELRPLYPPNWPELSRRVRFERAGGECERCRRPHGMELRSLPDGRWFDPREGTWRDRRGRSARWPDLEDLTRQRTTRIVLAAAHVNHDPTPSGRRNLRAWCQACHLAHDRAWHLLQRQKSFLIGVERRQEYSGKEGDDTCGLRFPIMALTSAQCRAARALLRMSQEELRLAARVAKKTIADLELDQREPYERTLDAIQAALEAAGVVFIDEREASDDGGEGVRLEAVLVSVIACTSFADRVR